MTPNELDLVLGMTQLALAARLPKYEVTTQVMLLGADWEALVRYEAVPVASEPEEGISEGVHIEIDRVRIRSADWRHKNQEWVTIDVGEIDSGAYDTLVSACARDAA